MGDSLGHRATFAVVAPSANTSVQPEYASMRPRGVTDHVARIAIPDTCVTDDASVTMMLENIRGAAEATIDVAMTMASDAVVMGMSAATFRDGADGADRLQARFEAQTGKPVMAEFWLEKPVIAINATTWWHVLRRTGIIDRIDGFGALMAEH